MHAKISVSKLQKDLHFLMVLNIFLKVFISCKWRNNNLLPKKLKRHNLKQTIISKTTNKNYFIMYPWHKLKRTQNSIHSILARPAYLHEKQKKINGKQFYKLTDWCSSKLSSFWKTKKQERMFTYWGIPMQPDS